ncbi:phospholipase A1 EG1, chloroplastic/mitochondrial [Zea mays]|uniref:Phospholipase A1 EG1, chloroplastic/mitochondrial n=2 Tax=Zea mays TaxID=4577 RepID=K7W2D1_MAIZE|nr:phospholipase A1 EG1, chloroplastic/mitochondrial [Zea mays]AQK98939.1 Galactolipase DONGLE chloroplastic [Zea mays]|eukprot:XP_008656976.2 phospholipase A1 EG1, chloroplastic/mitochondrial [Zea mays]
MASSAMIQPGCRLHQMRSPGRPEPSRASFAAAATVNEAATSPSISARAGTGARASAPIASAARTTSTPRRRTASVANMWRQVQGSHDWDGLLQPLQPVVRDEVARYGELVGACYKVLDVDPSSARYMCCKHAKERVLEEAGMAGAGYEVTRYIYATPDVAGPSTSGRGHGRASWVGYVAVSTDEMTRRLGRRDVLVSLRGTVTQAEWAANLMSALEPARLDARRDVKVEAGFLNLYTSSPGGGGGMESCRDQLLREVSRVIKSFSKDRPREDMSVTLAGHSMGSALAVLLGYDLSQLGLNRDVSGRRVPVTVFSFGGPRVGNAAFKDRCDELGVKVLRVANIRDPVTMLPGALFNEGTRGFIASWAAGDCYTHVGVELALDFLSLRDLGSVHDVGAYVSAIKAEACGKVSRSDNAAADSRGVAVLAKKAMEFIGSHRTAAFAWPETVLGIGGVVQSLGLI